MAREEPKPTDTGKAKMIDFNNPAAAENFDRRCTQQDRARQNRADRAAEAEAEWEREIERIKAECKFPNYVIAQAGINASDTLVGQFGERRADILSRPNRPEWSRLAVASVIDDLGEWSGINRDWFAD